MYVLPCAHVFFRAPGSSDPDAVWVWTVERGGTRATSLASGLWFFVSFCTSCGNSVDDDVRRVRENIINNFVYDRAICPCISRLSCVYEELHFHEMGSAVPTPVTKAMRQSQHPRPSPPFEATIASTLRSTRQHRSVSGTNRIINERARCSCSSRALRP